MSIWEIATTSGGALLILLTLVQIAPIKINPWSAIAKAFGRAVNADVLSELSDVKKQQKQAEEKLDEHIRIDDERDMNLRRQRILDFNAELIRGENYSHEHFVDMLEEIDVYERYCEDHKNYKNNRAVIAIANIKRVCEENSRTNGFLK